MKIVQKHVSEELIIISSLSLAHFFASFIFFFLMGWRADSSYRQLAIDWKLLLNLARKMKSLWVVSDMSVTFPPFRLETAKEKKSIDDAIP